jgi:hypothetical protein
VRACRSTLQPFPDRSAIAEGVSGRPTKPMEKTGCADDQIRPRQRW